MGFPAEVTIADGNAIEAFARLMEELRFIRVFEKYPRTGFSMTVSIYSNSRMTEQFEINGDVLHVPGAGVFRTERSIESVYRGLRRVVPHGQAMENALRRYGDLRSLTLSFSVGIVDRPPTSSAVPGQWCDALLEAASREVEETVEYVASLEGHSRIETADGLVLPVEAVSLESMVEFAREWKAAIEDILGADSPGPRRCPYAFNAQYTAESVEDVVTVFEADPGWNTIGGPELLTTRFVDPDGCFVSFNDHGVRFFSREQIRQIKAAAREAEEEGRAFEFRYARLLEVIDSGR
jgi:hypothetical protein